MKPVRRIVICECGAAMREKARAAAAAAASSAVVEVVEDLCAMASVRDGRLRGWTESEGLRVMACSPRAVKWLFSYAHAPLEGAEVVNLRELGEGAEAAGDAELHPNWPAVAGGNRVESGTGSATGQVSSWFPVIDFERCTHCLQCLGFCLFGVFGVDKNRRLEVAHGELCKPGCPACSRVCPEGAIVFPKHGSAPINGGAAAVGSEVAKVDLSAVLGGDVYATLRERSQKPAERGRSAERFSVERNAELALRERRRHLMEMMGEIPAEVLRQLPPGAELEQRAKEALERVAAAREGGK